MSVESQLPFLYLPDFIHSEGIAETMNFDLRRASLESTVIVRATTKYLLSKELTPRSRRILSERMPCQEKMFFISLKAPQN